MTYVMSIAAASLNSNNALKYWTIEVITFDGESVIVEVEARTAEEAQEMAASEVETLATCQLFNAEVCFESGLQYYAETATSAVKSQVEDFTLGNDLASYFLGVCQEFAPIRSRLLRGQTLWLRRQCLDSQRGRHKDCASVEKRGLLLPLCPG